MPIELIIRFVSPFHQWKKLNNLALFRELIPIVTPIAFQPQGINGIEARIQQIQQKLNQLGVVDAARESSSPELFSSLLNDKITAANSGEIEGIIDTEAQLQGMDPSLLKAVAKVESGFNPEAVSGVGAVGVMQLMPATAKGLGVNDLTNPVENIHGGATYLKSLLKRYDNSLPKALGAYNAGPGAVDKYGDVPPFNETQGYVKKVMAAYQQFQQQSQIGGQ